MTDIGHRLLVQSPWLCSHLPPIFTKTVFEWIELKTRITHSYRGEVPLDKNKQDEDI